MVVDDEVDIVEIMRRCLGKLGYSVFGFTNPFVALEQFELEAKKYRLVISDIRMPAMDGYELVKKIQNLQPETKVLLTSAFEINPHDFSKELPSVRVDGFISKPASLKQISIMVKSHMSAV
jgi:response regulator RpfG family c-di-GMP phosphodiesterase